jgi:polysaccharide deacetylase family sporulation protein PdaB
MDMKVVYLSKKRGIQLALAVCLLAASLLYAGLGGVSRSVFSESKKPLPVYSVETSEKKVAISFDAAWGDEETDGILEILNRYQAKSTFFLVGYWVDKYPEHVKEIYNQGHVIGNHSSTHPHMSGMGESQIVSELKTTSDKITALTGQPVTLFRPPYGDYDSNLVTVSRANGYEIVQWDVDSLDWKDLTADEILSRVKDKVGPGSIILFHNNSKHILPALEAVLNYLTTEGYECVTLPELLYPDNYAIDHTGRQFSLADATPDPT